MLPCVSFRRVDGTTNVVHSNGKGCLAELSHVRRVCEMSGAADCRERITPHVTFVHVSKPPTREFHQSNDESWSNRRCDPQHERVCGYDRGLPRGRCDEDGVCRVPSTATPGIAACEEHTTASDGSVLCRATRQRHVLRRGMSVSLEANLPDATSYECRQEPSSHTGGVLVRDFEECAASAAGSASFEYDAEGRMCAATSARTERASSHGAALVCRRL